MKHVQLQPTFVLHRRAYRETSLLLELFTEEFGRISVVAKGVRKPRSIEQSLLQPFRLLLVSFAGRGELMTLTQVEAREQAFVLRGDCLFAGLYLNELLIYLLQKWDAHADLFWFYHNTIKSLQSHPLHEKLLRQFEKFLLEVMGYGIWPKNEYDLKQTFQADKYYQFIPDQGLTLLPAAHQTSTQNVFIGKNLLAIAQEDWQDENVLQDAKRLMRLVFAPLLGERTLNSRRLFIKPEGG